MIEKNVDIRTRDGQMDTFICAPEEGGPSPAVIFYMDAPGIREELRDMARRIAAGGYCVVLPNLYYRAHRSDELPFDASRVRESDEERDKMWSLMKSIADNNLIKSDTQGMLEFLDTEDLAKPPPYGCVGYCMSGQSVFTAAGAFPDKFAAIASFYGVGLITDRDDSPHLLAQNIRGELYFAFAEDDAYVPQTVIDGLPEILDPLGVTYRIETYPGTEHGFAFPKRPCYNQPAAERHWERIFDLLRRRLS